MVAIDNFGESSAFSEGNDFLRISDLKEGMKYTKIAYLSEISTGFQKNNFGFVTFYLKDIEGNLIQARLFNVEDFMLSGVSASSMRKHAVKLSFVVQEFNGSLSLVIDGKVGISLWDGEFPYEKFLGKVEVNTNSLTACSVGVFPDEIFQKNLNKYAMSSFNWIAQGRAGGFLKVVDMALGHVCGCNNVVGLDFEDLLFVFFKSVDFYFDAITQRQKFNTFSDAEDYKILHTIDMLLDGDDRRALVVDCVRSLCGSKPKFLSSYIVKTAIESSLLTLNMSYQLNITPIGGKVQQGGVELLKL